MAPEVVGKQLEIIKQVFPQISRVALLGNPVNAGTAIQVRHAQEAARVLGMQLQSLEASGPSEIDRAESGLARSSCSWTESSANNETESQTSRQRVACQWYTA